MQAACDVYSVQYVPELQSVAYIVFSECMMRYVIIEHITYLIIHVIIDVLSSWNREYE